MDERVSTRDLIAALRLCSDRNTGCEGCWYAGRDGEAWCGGELARDAADRLEEYMSRCARYADEAMHRSVMLPRGGEEG